MSQLDPDVLSRYPGGELVITGIKDLMNRVLSEEALLVTIASPRLRSLGFEIPNIPESTTPYEHALYEALEQRLPRGAHSAYNALISRIVSFANAYGSNQPVRPTRSTTPNERSECNS